MAEVMFGVGRIRQICGMEFRGFSQKRAFWRFPVNSRFGRFNSRLGPKKFPVRPQREFALNDLIYHPFSRSNGGHAAAIDEIPGYFPGSREFAAAGRGRLPGLG
jgi:hypothetical protein